MDMIKDTGQGLLCEECLLSYFIKEHLLNFKSEGEFIIKNHRKNFPFSKKFADFRIFFVYEIYHLICSWNRK